MKILFILPPLFESGSFGLAPRFGPYFTVSTATQLRKAGFYVKIIDAFLENLCFSELALQAESYKPDIIVVPLLEINREIPTETVFSMIQYVKKARPKCIFVSFGKNDIEAIQKYFSANSDLDYYILGDPEETMLDLVSAIKREAEKNIFNIRGLLYRDKNKIVFTGIRIIDDINRLAFPEWDLAGLNKYGSIPHRYRDVRFYPVFDTRGCLWDKCIFCQGNDSIIKHQPFRVKSPQKITEEIMYAQSKYGCKEIQFYSAQFNTDKNWLLSLETEFRNNGVNIRWSCLSRIDKVDPEILSIMKRMGCWNILFGIESSNERLLRLMNKGITLEQIRNVVGWCKNERIEVTGSFLIGLPEEKPQDVYNSVSFARNIGFDYIQFFIAKWSDEHKEFDNKGYFTNLWDFSPYDFGGRIFVPLAYKNVNHLKSIQRKAYRRFYLHPKIILKHVSRINKVTSLRRLFFAARILLSILSRKEAVCELSS